MGDAYGAAIIEALSRKEFETLPIVTSTQNSSVICDEKSNDVSKSS